MDLDEAVAQVAGTPAAMSDLRQLLAERHSDHPQRAQLADMALRTVEAGLADLAKLGHQFHLVHGPAAEPEKFPLMLYRQGPGGAEQLTVSDEAELEAAKAEGWQETQAQAAPPEPEMTAEPPGPETIGVTSASLTPNPEVQQASPSVTGFDEGTAQPDTGSADSALPTQVAEPQSESNTSGGDQP